MNQDEGEDDSSSWVTPQACHVAHLVAHSPPCPTLDGPSIRIENEYSAVCRCVVQRRRRRGHCCCCWRFPPTLSHRAKHRVARLLSSFCFVFLIYIQLGSPTSPCVRVYIYIHTHTHTFSSHPIRRRLKTRWWRTKDWAGSFLWWASHRCCQDSFFSSLLSYSSPLSIPFSLFISLSLSLSLLIFYIDVKLLHRTFYQRVALYCCCCCTPPLQDVKW